MANKKEYKFEVNVSRGWGGVEQVQIASGTDNQDELKDLVNTMAESMQDRADNHQKQLKAVEEFARAQQERIQAEAEQAEPADEPTEEG